MDVHPTKNGMKIGIDPYPFHEIALKLKFHAATLRSTLAGLMVSSSGSRKKPLMTLAAGQQSAKLGRDQRQLCWIQF